MNYVLMFHEVGKFRNRFSISFSTFTNVIRKLEGKGFDIVSYEDFFKKGSKKKILLTFDDASTDFYDLVFPYIKKAHIPVALFVPTGLIGKEQRRSNGFEYKVMNKKQIKEVIESGLVTVCSHSVSHIDLTKLSIKEMIKEIKDSKVYLKKNFKVNSVGFSFPFGKFNPKIVRIAREHYAHLFTCRPGIYREGMTLIRRTEVTELNSRLLFAFYLSPYVSRVIPLVSVVKKILGGLIP